MSRYRGPKLRLVRRLQTLLPFLTQKKSKKKNPPGKNGNYKIGLSSKEYEIRLKEKQKLIYNYGISEDLLKEYVKRAKERRGITGLIFLQLLESRLDVICLRLGFAESLSHSRQLVNHGHILLNKQPVNIPSIECSPNDLITIRDDSTIKAASSIKKKWKLPSHLIIENSKKFEAKMLDYCNRDEILLEINELLVIEYYSRKL